MTTLDKETLRARIRAAAFSPGTPNQVALWRKDLEEAAANLAIEGMCLDAEDEALFAVMLEEGLSPTAMVEVIHTLYRKPNSSG